MRRRPPVSLAQRFALVAAALAGIALLVVSGTALWVIADQHDASLKRLLRKDAELQAALVSTSLHGVASRMSEIANSSMIANALIDSAGKEGYLVPFLNGIQRIQGIPVSILFTDFSGEEIARNGIPSFGRQERAWLAEKLREAKADSIVIQGPEGEELLAVEFIVYSRSDAPEGALMYKIRLDDIPRQSSVRLVRGDEALRIVEAGNDIALRIDAPKIYQHLSFVVAAQAGDRPFHEDARPLGLIFAMALAIAGIVVVAGRHFGRRMTRELRELEGFARDVAEKGFGTRRAQSAESVEVASLSASINRMLDRLNQQHDRFQHESEERYRLLVEGTSAISFEMSLPDFRFEFVSPQAERVFGMALEVWLLEGFADAYVLEDDRPALERFRRSAVAGARNYRCEYRLRNALGEPVWVEEIGSVLTDETGRPQALRGILLDISERKEAEQRVLREYEKVNRMKNEFISTVSHELRTPLTSIRGSLGLVLGGVLGALPDPIRRMIDVANQNCERLVRLINDILDVEKIEAGKMEFQFSLCELRPLLERAVETNQSYGAQYGVRFRLADSAPDVLVNVDRDRFMQVMANLLSNAAKYSPKATEVNVSAAISVNLVRVMVVDQGSGVPVEFHDKIFQKFSQADSSDSRHKGGTGLGLSICQAIVERMGGRIGFRSEEGRGSTFYFDLPVQQGVEMRDQEADTSTRN